MSWYDILRDLLRHSNKFTSFELNFVRQNIEHVLEYYVDWKWNQLTIEMQIKINIPKMNSEIKKYILPYNNMLWSDSDMIPRIGKIFEFSKNKPIEIRNWAQEKK